MPKAESLSEKWTVGWEVKLQGQMWKFYEEDNLKEKYPMYQQGSMGFTVLIL